MMKPPKNSSIRSTEINTQSYNQKNKNGDHKTAELSQVDMPTERAPKGATNLCFICGLQLFYESKENVSSTFLSDSKIFIFCSLHL